MTPRRALLFLMLLLVASLAITYVSRRSARAPVPDSGSPTARSGSIAESTASSASSTASTASMAPTAARSGRATDASASARSSPSLSALPEAAVTPIALEGPLAIREAEVSSLTWISDTLVFLPQYPGRFALDGTVVTDTRTGDGTLFGVRRRDIESALQGPAPSVAPFAIPLANAGFGEGEPRAIEGFEGFEAVVYRDGFAYLSIEVQNGDDIDAYLVRGRVDVDADGVPIGITLDAAAPEPVPLPIDIDNMSIESLAIDADGVLAMFESNGVTLNPAPRAWRFTHDLVPDGELLMPNLEFRVTDATDPEADGSFWVMNYMFPGDAEALKPSADALAQRWGEGATHAEFDQVERIVRLVRAGDRIALADAPPIQIQLVDAVTSRNWEGLVRLGDSGFLLVTDTFPQTLFAFVPGP